METTVYCPDIECDSCVRVINRSLGRLAGVQKINFRSDSVAVRYDPEKLSADKLVDVIKVVDMTELDHVEREMVLIKVAPRPEDKAEVLRLTEIFRGRVVDSSQKTYTIEITGDEKKIAAIVELLRPMGIKEFLRSGKIAIAREGVRKQQ